MHQNTPPTPNPQLTTDNLNLSKNTQTTGHWPLVTAEQSGASINHQPIEPTSTSTTPRTSGSLFDYNQVWHWLDQKGKQLFGDKFALSPEDQPVILPLICYFLRDGSRAEEFDINLEKGILLTGPVGCGKTTLMHLMRHLAPPPERHVVKSCREISFEFIKDGYEVIQRYSRDRPQRHEPRTFCFDDLGTEKNLKYFGNECNVLGEILLSRYDLFIRDGRLTHLTTNLNADELEASYGSRVRSRMRRMFNLVAFEEGAGDKRR